MVEALGNVDEVNIVHLSPIVEVFGIEWLRLTFTLSMDSVEISLFSLSMSLWLSSFSKLSSSFKWAGSSNSSSRFSNMFAFWSSKWVSKGFWRVMFFISLRMSIIALMTPILLEMSNNSSDGLRLNPPLLEARRITAFHFPVEDKENWRIFFYYVQLLL